MRIYSITWPTLIVAILPGSTVLAAKNNPVLYDLDELVVISSVIGVVSILEPIGLCDDQEERPEGSWDVCYPVRWHETWYRSPFIPDGGKKGDCRLRVREQDPLAGPGKYLLFAEYSTTDTYRTSASAINSVLEIAGDRIARWHFDSLKAMVGPKSITLEEAKTRIQSCRFHDGPQDFERVPKRGLYLATLNEGARFRVLTFYPTGIDVFRHYSRLHRISSPALPYQVRGFVDATRVTGVNESLLNQPYSEETFAITGKWVRGSYLVEQVVVESSGQALLSTVCDETEQADE
ncbi:MAG: hypothetical protein JSU63_18015 [Phycisphaerales bacterium]|nr:MAG: hypothetical protein JSU63_18015 [Phycisphaerales bacterium]